ncbi:hypothetical protein KFL_001570090 [Klebsormidium nitens]|uniref:F-box domain-containing protein n=1 Tax=Klebsormidium nitens TaxID=105231 RepID=A0A0U9HV12_KLENI|nr:hypothetical protein KFL_001570090 [Klebsormidium nitens]|eukprot:GAQ83670.1 hypothetical protein KFL_001570090 [Klebsormidium nitens]
MERSNDQLLLQEPGNAKAAKPEVTGFSQLPDGALFNIFNKLASQDPPALLAASAACKNFHSVASSHASLWRAAFYSPSEPPDPKEHEAAAFQETVESFGGFEALVRARWARTMSKKLALNKTGPAVFEESITKIESQSAISLLVLIRTLQGRLCLYGAGQASCKVKSFLDSWSLRVYFYAEIGHLHPLFAIKDLPADVTEPSWADVDVNLESYILLGGGSVKWVPLYKATDCYVCLCAMNFDSVASICWHVSEPGVPEVDRKSNVEMCLHATFEDAEYNGIRVPPLKRLSRSQSGASVEEKLSVAFVDWGIRVEGYCGSPAEAPEPKDPEAAAFGEVVERFGGYEALVRARWAKEMSERLACYKNKPAFFEESLKKIESRSEISFLVLVRTLQGRLCLYGVGQASRKVQNALYHIGFDAYYFSKISHLHPLCPIKNLPVEITEVSWAKADVQLESYIVFGGGSVKWAPLYKNEEERRMRSSFLRTYYFDSASSVCWHFAEPGKYNVFTGNVELCLHATFEDAHFNCSRMHLEASANREAFLDWGIRLSGLCGIGARRYSPGEEAGTVGRTANEDKRCNLCGRPLSGFLR